MNDESLCEAIQDGNLDLIRSIIASDPAAVQRPCVANNRSTPLHIAILCGLPCSARQEIVSSLILAGAEVNAVGDYERTPLHLAAQRSDGLIAAELLRAGAQVDANDGFDTPLDISLRSGDYYCVGLFLLHGATISIHSAVLSNRIDWVRWILSENPGAVREWWRSDELIRDAIQAANFEILRQLISAGANLNPDPSYSIHPLWTAIERSSIGAVRILLEAGADPNGCRPQAPLPDWRFPGWTSPLEIAKERGFTEAETLLKQYGATE